MEIYRALRKKIYKVVIHFLARIKFQIDKIWLPLKVCHKELYLNIHYITWTNLRRFPNLVNPRDYNDCIQWLKLFDQEEKIIDCCDKIRVREYTLEKLGSNYHPKLYQVYENFDQIEFETLPNSFVIKTNHDSGTVILVTDKFDLDRQSAKRKVEKALRRPHGWFFGEWPYAYIKPKILIEEYIDTLTSVSPPDYKFHCVAGKVKWLQYIFDRDCQVKECIVDRDGQPTALHLDPHMLHSEDFNKPECWERLISIAEALSDEFKYVRVDLFLNSDRIIVGELTFFPYFGCYRSKGQKDLGEYMDFDKTTFKDCILDKLEEGNSRYGIYPLYDKW